MTLVLTLAATSLWQTVLQQQSQPAYAALSDALNSKEPGWVGSEVSLTDLAKAVEQCQHIYLVYDAPETALGQLLAKGVSVAQALEQWQKQYTNLINWQRQLRRKVTLVNLTQLATCSDADLNQVNALLQTNGFEYILPFQVTSTKVGCTIYELAAYQLISNQPSLNELTELLQASSLPLTAESPVLDVTALLQQLEQQRALKKAEEKAAAGALQLTQEQNTQLQQTLQLQTAANQQLTTTVSEIQQQFSVAKSSWQQQQLQSKNEFAQLQHQHTDLVQQLHTAKQQLTEQHAALTKQLHSAQQQLSDQQAQAKLAQTENQQLLGQLLHVQEALEQHYLDNQALQEQLVQSQQTAEQQKKQLTLLGQQHNDRASELQNQFTVLQQELANKKLESHQLSQQCASAQQQVSQLSNQLQQSDKANQQINSSLVDTQTENQQLLDQLLAVQEELEHYYLKLQHSTEQHHQQQVQWQQQLQQLEQDKQRQHTLAVQQQKQQLREYTKLTQQFNKQRAELAGSKYHTEQLSQQLQAMQSSASWKIAAPVRVLSRAIKKTDKDKQRLQQDIGLLFTSELFDADWYLATYTDIKDANANPAEHYLKYGAAEGRLPSAEFDGNWYLQRYPDVAESGVNPLLHYIKFGRNEGRTASPKLLENHLESRQG